jgi:hypothetical protein
VIRDTRERQRLSGGRRAEVLANRTETKRIAWIRLAKRFANALFTGFCAASKARVLIASPTPNYMTVRILARRRALLTALFGFLDT